jgi:hypothetical protein
MARKMIGPKGSRRRRWLFLCTTLVALAAAAFFISGAGAIVPDSPSNFETSDALVPNSNPPVHDGNMTVDTAGNSDWNCFANGNSTGFANPVGSITVGSSCNSALKYSAALAKPDPAATTSDDSWVNGTKMDVACAPVGTNKNQPKDDFTAIASYSEQRAFNKHQYLYGATVRVAPNGNASENVELNQFAGTATCPITRTARDHLLAFDYLNGGATLNLHVLTWIDSTNPTADGQALPGGKCIIKTDSMPCWGATVITPASAAFEGDVSQSQIDAVKNGINNQLLPAGEFAEFGVDLTTALNQNPNACNTTSQTDWESRASGSSFSSNPADIAIETTPISNCGSITIVKNTDPRNVNQNFSYTASGGSISPASFKLNDRSALTISSISAANPAVVTTSAAIATGLNAGDKVGVTITGSNSTPSANGNWTGTVIDSTHFSIPLAVTTAGGAAGSVTFNTEVYKDLLGATTYTFNESSQTGFALENLTCQNNNGTADTTVVNKATATVTIPLAANDNWVCTYQNQALGEIKIIKHTDPRGIDQAFGFTSDLPTTGTSCSQSTAASFSLNDKNNTTGDSLGNTQDCTAVPVGTYHVTEGTEPSGFSLEGLTCTASTGSSGAQDGTTLAKANITIVAGGLVTCTYQNQATGTIKIIKHTDPRGIDQAFSFTSDLPTTGTTSCTKSTAASFSLNDTGNSSSDGAGNTQNCTTVPVGTYHVTETEPSGWTLESLTCVPSTGSSSGGPHASGSLQADITIAAGGSVTCTYQNKPPSGAILVTKTGKYKGCTTAGTAIMVNGSQIGVCTGNATAALGGASFDVSNDAADTLPVTGSPITTSNTTGKACIDGLFWNGTGNHYFVTEKGAPGGYSIDLASAVDVVVSANATCNATHDGLAAGGTSGVVSGTSSAPSFTDTPLSTLEVIATSETANATKSTITCTHVVSGSAVAVGTPITTPIDPADWKALHLKPDTYTCTVVIDP